jgi:hypothetical protein
VGTAENTQEECPSKCSGDEAIEELTMYHPVPTRYVDVHEVLNEPFAFTSSVAFDKPTDYSQWRYYEWSDLSIITRVGLRPGRGCSERYCFVITSVSLGSQSHLVISAIMFHD